MSGKRNGFGNLLTTHQAAKLAGIHFRTVIRWCDTGKLPHVRLPGSPERRIYAQAFGTFLRTHGWEVPRELMCGARVTYGITPPAPLPGWDHCDAFQLGELCSTKPVLAAVLGDEWGVAAAVKAADHIRRNNPDAQIVFVLDPSNAAAPVPGEVRVRGEVELGELLGAL